MPERRLQQGLQKRLRRLMLDEPFEAMSGIPLLARIPLLPATGAGGPGPTDGLVAEGMFLASRAVEVGDRRDDRMQATLRAYELRARFRPTPHGVFAGVALASVDDGGGELLVGGAHLVRTYPHPEWLAAVVGRALMQPGVLQGLRLTTSNLVVRRGDRLEREQDAVPDVAAPQLVTVRATAATLLILSVCASGASYDTVTVEVTRSWPQAPADVIHSTVLALVRSGFLLIDLLPESDHQDPLTHVIDRLPAASPLRRPLERLHGYLGAADRCPPGAPERITALSAARRTCDEIAEVSRPLAADVAADARITIPAALARQAAEAAGVLWRISQGIDPIAAYHRRFVDRYGPDRFVPLCEVVDPAVGLGAPDDQPDGQAFDRSARIDRAAILADLISEALTSGRIEVELSEAAVTALDRHPADLPPPPTAEVYARVLTGQGGAAGGLSLALYGGGNQEAGSTAGRFVGLLPAKTTAVDARGGSELVAEVVVRPRTPQLARIAPASGAPGPRIPVGVPSRPGDLELDDLQLASIGGRFVLWSAQHDRPVLPVLLSRIGPLYTPPAARLLAGLSAHGCRPWHGWSWDPMHRVPFQPRVTYRQTILSPARWRLPATLTGAARDPSRWEPALATWQAATVPTPPEMVVIEDTDRHLPLDLREDTDRQLLRRYFRRGITAVTELPGGHPSAGAVLDGPDGRHVLELVIPLRRRTAPAPTTPAAP
ncbi:lantibiotic dehydratase family protein, partial [Rhizohabitans arisaemae]|uniref:lantibiotic dehydratase family protein n=1 Tax=Rhizohabitans arisaemae TaxID=2720610 RepID=UPI0024B1CF84